MYNMVTLLACTCKHMYVPEIITLYEPKSVFLNYFAAAAHFETRKMMAKKMI